MAYFGFTAVAPNHRRQFHKTVRPLTMVTVSIGTHATLRQFCFTMGQNLPTAVGQQVAHDFMGALSRLDAGRLLQIVQFAQAYRQPRPLAPPPPQRAKPPAPSVRELAVQFLQAANRDEDAKLVSQVAARFSELSPAGQVVAGAAIRTVVDAYVFLNRLTPQHRTSRGSDGTTPEEDASFAVSAALARLASSLHDAQQGDTDRLRALRRYADQWAARPDDPLNLG
ncbi:hypothetical protein [Calidifontibacter terrae]